MAVYARSQVCKALRLARLRLSEDHALISSFPAVSSSFSTLSSSTSCLSFVIGANKRIGQPDVIHYPLIATSRWMSTAGVLQIQGGLFHRCNNDMYFLQRSWSVYQFSKWYSRETSQIQENRKYCQKTDETETTIPPPKPSIWKRFKDMYKEYWYVLVPVHIVTSIIWYGSFYYLASSGFDLVGFLEKMGSSESIIKPFRNSKAGYFAIAYAMYKIATPARYTVTLGGTTVSINYLRKWGYIKPIPNSAAIQKMIKAKRAAFQQGLHKRQAARRARIKEREDKRRSSQNGMKK